MLKHRLVKLEQDMNPPPKPRVHVVEQDRDIDHMEILGLSFSGTIQAGNELMAKRPYDQFLIFEGTLED